MHNPAKIHGMCKDTRPGLTQHYVPCVLWWWRTRKGAGVCIRLALKGRILCVEEKGADWSLSTKMREVQPPDASSDCTAPAPCEQLNTFPHHFIMDISNTPQALLSTTTSCGAA